MKDAVTTKQKYTRNKKESKHNIIESHQHRRAENKRVRKEQRRTVKND